MECTILTFLLGTIQSFEPKLVLTIDAVNGIPLDLNFSEKTRRSLENLVQRNTQTREAEYEVRSSEVPENQVDGSRSEKDDTRRFVPKIYRFQVMTYLLSGSQRRKYRNNSLFGFRVLSYFNIRTYFTRGTSVSSRRGNKVECCSYWRCRHWCGGSEVRKLKI